jgi:hypothetical protein
MPVWLWVLAVIGALAAFLFLARRSFRSSVRHEVLEELKLAYLDLEVLEDLDDHLVVKSGSVGEVRINLANLYIEVARAGGSPEARSASIRRFLSGLHRQAAESGPLTLERHGDRILPRLVPREFVEKAPSPPLPHRPVGDTGLVVAYVLDQPTSVAYLHRGQVRDLGLDDERLHDRAMANLARDFPDSAVEGALKGSLGLVRLGDSHDATRLLLVPARLKPGQALAALVPDSDTLVLAPCPAADGWKALARTSKAGGGKPVLPGVALRVAPEGITRA